MINITVCLVLVLHYYDHYYYHYYYHYYFVSFITAIIVDSCLCFFSMSGLYFSLGQRNALTLLTTNRPFPFFPHPHLFTPPTIF